MFRVGRNSQISRLKPVSRPLTSSRSTLPDTTRCTKHIVGNLNAKRFSSTTSKKSSIGVKIAGSLVLLTGGGLLGGAVVYNYNADFRKFVNQSLPIIETFNLALGPATGNNNNNGNTDEEKSLLKPIITPKVPASEKASEMAGKGEVKKSMASLSLLDQTTVSSLDLDIATAVEGEINQVQKVAPTKGQPHPPKGSLGPSENQGSAANFLSAVDQTSISAVDLDITRTAEFKDKKTEPIGKPNKENVVLSDPQDTSLTEKELEHIADQTTMEIHVDEALLVLKQSAQESIEAQKLATELVLLHVKQLKNALEYEDAGGMKDLGKNVLDSQKDAENAISEAKASQLKVNQKIEKLHATIKEAEAAGAKEAGVRASEIAAKVNYKVLNTAAELQKAMSEDTILGEHQKSIEESKSILKKELEEIIPGALKLEVKGKWMKAAKNEETKSDAVLLLYARKRLDHLKQELAHQREEEQKRLEQVLSVQREEDDKLAEIKIKQEMDKLNAEFNISLKKRESELALEHETTLRQQLRRQAAAYSDHLSEVLRVQSQELQERHNRELSTKLNEEKESYSSRLGAALSRLRGIESAVDDRAEIEQSNKTTQELWVACQSLQQAIDSGLKSMKPLYKEVHAIYTAAPDDITVTKILTTLPEEALERGVYSEKNLASRFPDVHRSCRRVAMVAEDNKGPWTYFWSFIQSFFVAEKFDPRKDGDLIDVENTDTFGLLARAEYYVRKGDLELAARFVNQLKGEPRKLAYDWLKEVRLLLETRQAAKFLSSYAAAAGMGGSN